MLLHALNVLAFKKKKKTLKCWKHSTLTLISCETKWSENSEWSSNQNLQVEFNSFACAVLANTVM